MSETARRLLQSALAAVATLALVGCPGDGSRIMTMMNGGGDGPEPTLSWLQANVFSPVCTECHVPGGPGPMPLTDEATTFQNLVNVQSVELQNLLRVEPGNAQDSYIVWKVEGRMGILGDRMPPPPRAMLQPGAIQALIDWIDSGAAP